MTQHLINNKKLLEEAVHELATHARLSHDTETMGPPDVGGLHPFHGSRSFSHIFATEKDEYYFDFNVGGINPKYKEKLQPIFNDNNKIIFYVNAIFDATISHFDNLVFKQRIADCPSIARVEYNQHDGGHYNKDESFLSLAYLANYYDIKAKNDKVKQYIKEHQLYSKMPCRFTGKPIPLYNLVPIDLMFEYGCDDARSTYDLGEAIIRCINYKDNCYEKDRGGLPPMINVAKNEMRLTTVLIDMKINGAKLWADYVKKALKHEKIISQRLHKEIDKLTGGINLNSPGQVAKYLIEKGVKIPRKLPTETALIRAGKWEKKALIAKTTGKEKQLGIAVEKARNYRLGNYITDKKTLEKLMEKYPKLDFLSKISQAKEADKKISTYYGNFLKLVDDFGIIHCQLNQEKAITGRFSSSNPNFQNLHKEKWDGTDKQFLIRKSIISKGIDFNLFFFDYKGQEMYIMIDLAYDIAVINDIIENGTDIYVAMTNLVEKFTGITITRQQAKHLALGVAYGQGKALIARKLNCSIDDAMGLKAAFLKALAGVFRLNKHTMRTATNYGKIHNPYGRVSYIDRGYEYKSLNSLIQGTAADCTKTAMVGVAELLNPKKYKSHMIIQVHDEIIIDMHKNEHHLIPEIRKIMCAAYKHKHLPLRVDVEWSKRSWGEKLKWQN